MPRRPEPRDRPLAGTALRRRPGQPTSVPELQTDGAVFGQPGPRARGTAARQRRGFAPSSANGPSPLNRANRFGVAHPLSDLTTNASLRTYDLQVKEAFDRIVPLLKQLSALQHEPDFVERAQQLSEDCLGFKLPLAILERAWVSQLEGSGS